MASRFYLVQALIWFSICIFQIESRTAIAQPENPSLKYEPHINSLQGNLKSIDLCASESSLSPCPIYLLTLHQPIDIEGDPNSETNREDALGVEQIQVILPNLPLIGDLEFPTAVQLSGTLFRAHTAYHRTEILMTVQNISYASTR